MNAATETTARILIDMLVSAFGGWSQLPNVTIGQALRGHVVNQGMDLAVAKSIAWSAALHIDERWETDDVGRIADEILKGLEGLEG